MVWPLMLKLSDLINNIVMFAHISKPKNKPKLSLYRIKKRLTQKLFLVILAMLTFLSVADLQEVQQENILSLRAEVAYADVNVTACDQFQGTAAPGTNLIDNPGETFILQNDIDCANGAISPIFPSNNKFTGTLEGGNFTISNFTVPATTRSSVLGYTNGATIQNLSIDNADVSCNSGGNCGILIGDDIGSTIDSVQITNSNLTQNGGQDRMGALIGTGLGSQVSNVTIDLLVLTCTDFYSGSCEYIGGAIGFMNDNASVQSNLQNITVSNSTIYGHEEVGGVVGYAINLIADNLTANSVTLGGTSAVGGVIGYFQGASGLESTLTNSNAVNITHDPESYFTAIGTSTTSATLVGGLVGYSGNYTSINCGGETTSFTNVPLSNVNRIGGLIGHAQFLASTASDPTNYTVENCSASGSITGKSSVGGLIGDVDEGRYNNVHSTVSIKYNGSSPSNIGGLMGLLDFAGPVAPFGLNNCSYSGIITPGDFTGVAPARIGGLVADLDHASIDSCTVDVSIIAPDSNYIAGVAATAGGSSSDTNNVISNIVANVQLQGEQYVGGIVGQSSMYFFDNLSASGSIEGNPRDLSRYVGGIVGQASGTSAGVYSKISNSDSSVRIRRVVQYAGGVAGFTTYTPVNNSYNTGEIEAFQGYAGGIVGSLQNGGDNYAVDEVYNTGDIKGDLNYVGGLIGNMGSATPIRNSYSTGDVSGGERVGGLIGYAPNAPITNSYSTGRVIGAEDFGGLVGDGNASSSATDSYWDTQTSKQSFSYVGEGKTTAEMFTPATYSTWDSGTIWNICTDNYPVLQSLGQSCPVLEPVIFEVNTNEDTSDATPGDSLCSDSQGLCSLRAAMEEIDALSLAGRENRVTFNLPLDSLTISLTSSLPTISGIQINIDGTTQPSYLGSPIIELDSSAVAGSDPILEFSNADDSFLQGLAIFGSTHSAPSAVVIANSDNFILRDNFFGQNSLNLDGGTTLDLALSIDNSDGALVKDNVFAHPLDITDSNNVEVLDNIFELENVVTNDFGIQFRDGGNAFIFRNSFYDIDRAIVIRDDSASLPVIENNIKENEGTNITLMIDLIDDANAATIGKNANDVDDVDDGPNKLLNSPELSEVSYDNSTRTLTITGDFNSEDGNYRFDFYTSDGNDESRKYINYFVEAVSNNNLTFTNQELFIPRRDVVPSYISATAQDEDGNTSEHSELLAVDSVLITSCDQLAGGNPAAVANHIEDDYTGFYRLANDIDCSAYTGGSSFDPIGSSNSAEYFKGVLVGDGNTISNLEISDAGTYIGLFARTETAIVQDVNFENISINCTTNSSNYCGLITGYADQMSVEDVTVTQGVSPGANPVGINGLGSYTAGLVGYARASNFLNINSDIDVNGNTAGDLYVGGVVGYTAYFAPTNRGYATNEFRNVHITGDVTGYSYVGGITGKGEDIDMLDVSYTGTITSYSNYAGGLSGSVNSASLSNILARIKNATVTVDINSGASGNFNSVGGAVGIVNNGIFENITVNGEVDGSSYSKVGGAFGSLNGNSSYQENNTMSDSHPFYAKNITANVDITNGTQEVGGIAGYTGYMNLSNINYTGTISHDSPTGSHSNIGGLIGNGTYVVVEGGTASSPNPISYATASVGGAFGNIAKLQVDSISSDISIPGVKNRGGGLIGSANYMTVTNSYATGSVGDFDTQDSTSDFGGLLGECALGFCYISDSYATGDVEGDGSRNGGLVGELTSSDIVITNSYATGDVNVTGAHSGGLIGYLSSSGGTASLTNVYASGDVSSTSLNNMGALLGEHPVGTLNITESYASGNISTGNGNGVSHCGGLVGRSASTLNIVRSYTYGTYNCQSLGSTGSDHGFGGLVGEMSAGLIQDSYSHSTIVGNHDSQFTSDNAYLGGLVGNITGVTSVIDSYSTGSVTALYSAADPADDPVVGGLIGNAPSASFTDSFWDTQSSGVLTSAGGTGKLTSEMKDQDTFTTGGPDWDFASTWEMCAGGGYATHQWMNYCPLGNPFEFVVNTTNDTNDAENGDRTCLDNAGNCSLRAAIEELIYMQANEQESVTYNINFDIAGPGPHIISLDNSLGYLPELSNLSNFTIDGESEPSFVANPVVYVDASSLTTSNTSVFDFEGSNASSIRGIGVLGFQELDDAAFNISNSTNISLSNIKSGITSAGALDATTEDNSISVLFTNTSNSSLLNSELARPMELLNGSSSNTIQGNSFDLQADTYDQAIYIENSSGNSIDSNEFNTAQVGIVVNQITGSTANANTLSQNTAQNISSRVIELQVNGSPSANANDIAQDLDNGANTLLNFPVISDGDYDADNDTLTLQGTVETANGADYYIEFFESDGSTDEAISYLGSSATFTVADNLYNFNVTLNGITSAPLNATATLTDASGNTSQHSANRSLNDPPTDIQISNNNVDETPNGGAFDVSSVGTLTTTDGDVGDTHTYQILSIDGDVAGTEFSIGGLSNDELIQEEAFDYEVKTSYDVSIRTTDSKGVSYDETLTIEVNDLNDNAPDLTPENFNVDEDNADPSATLTVTDVDTVGSVTLTITGGADQNDFEISGTVLSFKAGSLPLDYETKETYTVEVTASDGVNATDTESFTFNVQDVNEAPTVENPIADFSVDQDDSITPVVASGIFDDEDAGANGVLTFTATQSDDSAIPDWLSFNGTTLSGTPDNDDVGTVSIKITATDGGALSTSDTFNITVDNLNDLPVIENQTLDDVSEVAANGTVVDSVTAIDPDSIHGDSLEYSITAGNTGSAFAISSTTGQITVNNTAAIDYETSTSFTLTVQVEDDAGETDTAQITIPVVDADDSAPVITAGQSGDVDENSALNTIVLNVLATDSDTAGNLANWTITAGDDNNAFQISAHPTNNKQGQITVADPSELDYETTTSYTLSLTVSDGINTSATQTVDIDINDLNDNPPAITAGQSGSIDENSADESIVFTPVATDVDTSTTLQDWTITGGTGQNLFEINSSTGQITYESDGGDLDYETTASYTLDITVSDGVNTSSTQTVDIDINDINDAPNLDNESISIDEELANGGLVIDLDATDQDAGGTITYSITNGNNDIDGDLTLPFSIDSATGEVTVADSDDLDYEEITQIILTVTATDDGAGNLSDTSTITINLNPVNDEAPVISTPGAITIDENETTVVTVESTDPDGVEVITYTITAGDDQALFQIDENTGELSFLVAPDFENPSDSNTDNIYQVEVTATDTNANSTAQLISIQVSDIGEAPVDPPAEPSSSGSSSSGSGGSGSSPFNNPDSSTSTENELPEQNEQEEQQAQQEQQQEQDQSTQTDSDPEQGGDTGSSQSPEQGGGSESQSDDQTQSSGSSEPEDETLAEDELPEQNEQEEQETQQEQQQTSSLDGSQGSSQGSSGNSSSSSGSAAEPISCSELDEADYSKFEYADLDCDPLEENLQEEEGEQPAVALNLPQDKSSSFPSEKFYITGKVYNTEEVSEVEVYAEIGSGNNIILGKAEVDNFGRFSLLNKKSIPKNQNIELKARAIIEEDEVESPNYLVNLSDSELPRIPTELMSFTDKTAAQLLETENGYFTFVNTAEFLNRLELRVKSQFRTRHNFYWNSILIGSSAITGSNSNETVVYAPQEVLDDIKPYSRHKVTVVAESVDNPNQKGIPLVIDYMYIPTYTYYIAFLLVFLLLLLVLSKKLKKKSEQSI